MAAQIFTLVKILQEGLPIHKPERVTTTNFVFRLHTKYVSTICITTGVLLFIQQLFIDHLKCFRPLQEGTALESAVLNQYCYATGTYALLNETYQFTENKNSRTENRFYFHHSFQWVPIILFIQGLTFYLPQFLWSTFVENGRLEAFVIYKRTTDTSNNPNTDVVDCPIAPETETAPCTTTTDSAYSTTTMTGICFAKTLSSLQNKLYFYGFFTCEFINLLMVLITFFFTDWLLQGHFINLGQSWIDYLHALRTFPQNVTLTHLDLHSHSESTSGEAEDTNFYTSRRNFEIGNPLELAFPTLFTCEWTKPAFKNVASVTYSNIKCVMGLNLTHQRIYLVFWFGLVLLFVINLVNLLYRIVIYTSPKVRRHILRKEASSKGLRGQEEVKLVKEILHKMQYYDCFILSRILANVCGDKFIDCCKEVEEQLQIKSSKNGRNKVGTEISGGEQETGIEMEPMTKDYSAGDV